MEHDVQEVAKWFLGILLIVTLVEIGTMLVKVQEVNTYKQQVGYHIERRGGLTSETIKELDEYADEKFNLKYTLQSDKLNQKLSFGETVDYKIQIEVPFVYFKLPSIKYETTGVGVSQVR